MSPHQSVECTEQSGAPPPRKVQAVPVSGAPPRLPATHSAPLPVAYYPRGTIGAVYMRSIGCGLALAAWTVAAFAGEADTWNTATPEAAFVFSGAPVHPECLEGLGDSLVLGNAVDLGQCAKRAEGGLKPVKHDGRVFSAENSGDDEEPGGYAEYQVLANRGPEFLIRTTWNGGGTGIFDSLQVVRLNGAKLAVVKQLMSGDRCNGGLFDHGLAGNIVRYSVNLTPYDLIALGGDTKLEAYSDLSASAQSCVAKEDQQYDLDTGKTQQISVTLTGAWFARSPAENASKLLEDEAGWTENYKYDHCFNAYYNTYVKSGRLVLKPAEVKAFADGFRAACVK